MFYLYKNEWCGSLERSPILHEYKQFKTPFKYEQYFDILTYNLRCVFTKYICMNIETLLQSLNVDIFNCIQLYCSTHLLLRS